MQPFYIWPSLWRTGTGLSLRQCKRGHRCMVYTQLAILHTALQSQQEPSPALSSDTQEPSAAERAHLYWQPEWSTWLSSHCSVCKIECAPQLMEEHHRVHHDHLIQPALKLYDNCVSHSMVLQSLLAHRRGCGNLSTYVEHCCEARVPCHRSTCRWTISDTFGGLIESRPVQPLKDRNTSSKGNRTILTTNFQGWFNS